MSHSKSLTLSTVELEKQPKSSRLPGLDGIRAFAVIMVVLSHYTPERTTGTFFDSFLNKGGFGVEIFFVLSGFLITYLLIKEEISIGNISLRFFYARRFIRIVPPLYFFLFLIWIANLLKILTVNNIDFVAGLLFIRNYIGTSSETGHLWTLAIEEQFYLFWPLLLIAFKSPKIRIIGCAAIVLALPFWAQFNYLLYGGAENVNSWRTDLRLQPMMIGALLALMLSVPKTRRILLSPKINNLIVVGIALSILCLYFFSDVSSIRFVRNIYPLLTYLSVALIINFSISNPKSLITSVLEFSMLAWLGRLSYSLYLWQQLFSADILGMKPAWFREFPINLFFAFSLAVFSYYVVEKPLFSLRRKFRK